MRFLIISLSTLLLAACTSPSRENPVDPFVAPLIEMSEPVLDNGTILVQWRYLSEGDGFIAFDVRKVATLGDIFPSVQRQYALLETPQSGGLEVDQGIIVTTTGPRLVGRVDRSELDVSSGWHTASLRDTEVAVGVRILYQVGAVDASGDFLSADIAAIRVEGN